MNKDTPAPISFFLDELPESLANPISGMDVYLKAGNPPKLWDGKHLIPKTWKAYVLGVGAKVTTKEPQ